MNNSAGGEIGTWVNSDDLSLRKSSQSRETKQRNIALKGPQETSKINALRAERFQPYTCFYNELQIGCPI